MTTLAAMLAARAEADPDGLAFTFGGRRWSYREVFEAAGRAAGRFQQAGVTPGDRVLVALPNGAEFFAAFYGALRAGAVTVPVFPGLGATQVAATAQRCDAALVVTAGSWQEDGPDPEPVDGDPDDVAFIQYTSGSTGEPRGVMITHRNLLTNIEQMVSGMAITPDDRFVSWLPTYHDMGLILMTMVPFALGIELHLLPTSLRTVDTWLRTIADVGGTFTAAPDFAYRLALRRVQGRVDLSSLRMALNAAEPVRAATIAGFEERFGLRPGVMVAGYGLAEATVGVTTWPPGSSRPRVDDRGIVSVGPPFPGVTVRIADDGEIQVRTTAAPAGYYRDPDATAATFGADGWIRTGDLGHLDDDGNLYVVGRKKEIIITGGRNLAPQEIVRIADDRPEVRMAAAVGIDRGGLEGEQPHVFAEVRGADDLHELAVEIAADIWSGLGIRPARVHLLRPGTIPLTHNGKVRAAALREQHLAGTLPVLYPAS